MQVLPIHLPRMLRMQHARLAHAALFPWVKAATHRTVASAVQQDTDYETVSPSDAISGASISEASLPDFPTQAYDRLYANYVSLIGHLGGDPEFMTFSSGRCLSKLRLAINRGAEPDRVTDWYDVEAWDDLAKQCNQHLTKGAWVNIQGRLRVNSWTDKETQAKRSKVQIVASNIERVQSLMQPSPVQAGGNMQYSSQTYSPQQPTAAYTPPSASQAYLDSAASGSGYSAPSKGSYEVWYDLINDPNAFWDNRENKRNPKGPDFKHKTSGAGLWLDSAPVELRDMLAERGLSRASVPF